MKGKMTLAEKLRAEVDEKKKVEEETRKERAEAHEVQLKADIKRNTPRFVADCLREAKRQADEGNTKARISRYGETAHAAAEEVAELLRKEGFTVTARPDHTATRIDGDGYDVGGFDPYCVWTLEW